MSFYTNIIIRSTSEIEQASKHLQEASDLVPLSLERSIVQKLNLGDAAEIIRPIGTTALRYILRDKLNHLMWM